jgi:hypothetical protein
MHADEIHPNEVSERIIGRALRVLNTLGTLLEGDRAALVSVAELRQAAPRNPSGCPRTLSTLGPSV